MPGSISYPVAFVSNGQGGLTPSSAQSAMLAALAEDIRNAPARVEVPDHKMMPDRQARVDRHLAENHGISRYEANPGTVVLPRIASPQRLFTTFAKSNSDSVARSRSAQHKELEGSFLGALHDKFHIVMDKAVKQSKEIESEILSRRTIGGGGKGMFSSAMSSLSKNVKGLSEEEKSEAFRPIEESIEFTNKWMKSQDYPVRLVWRRIVEPNNQWSVDTWLVFANSTAQAQHGISTWFGSTDIVDPRDRLNKDTSRLEMYLP